MEALFLRILKMSLAGGAVILLILPLRLLLRRAPKRFSYLLWAAAAFRLCVPASLPSPFSLFRLLSGTPAAPSAPGPRPGSRIRIPSSASPTAIDDPEKRSLRPFSPEAALFRSFVAVPMDLHQTHGHDAERAAQERPTEKGKHSATPPAFRNSFLHSSRSGAGLFLQARGSLC